MSISGIYEGSVNLNIKQLTFSVFQIHKIRWWLCLATYPFRCMGYALTSVCYWDFIWVALPLFPNSIHRQSSWLTIYRLPCRFVHEFKSLYINLEFVRLDASLKCMKHFLKASFTMAQISGTWSYEHCCQTCSLTNVQILACHWAVRLSGIILLYGILLFNVPEPS